MKRAIICILAVAAIITACEESGPDIILTEKAILTDTTYVVSTIESQQTKNVLMEEFTGVRCTNCPKGHDKAKEIHNAWGDRFIFVSFHSDFLDDPYPFDTVDMGSPEAQLLDEFLGPATAKPSSAIDRVTFPGESEVLLFIPKWSNYTDDRMSETTPVNIHVTASYDDSDKELIVSVRIHYTEAVTDDNKLSILLIENDIIAAQLDGTEIDTTYEHDEVFRAFISEIRGNSLISPDKNPGREFIKEFSFTEFGDDWKVENMAIIAYVHKDDNQKEVYQAVHADF
jgi:hypothetical protein